MRKFEVVDLEKLPKGARFYMVGNARKTVYEIAERNSGDPFIRLLKLVGTSREARLKTFNRIPSEKVKCVFLSLPQDRQKQ